LRSSRALSTEPGGFVGLSALFAGLSDLRSPWAGLSGFCADCGCVGVLSESDAACAAAAPSAIAATMKHVSRNAFTDTDLSVAARYCNLLRLVRIEEKLRRAPCNRRFSRQKRGAGP